MQHHLSLIPNFCVRLAATKNTLKDSRLRLLMFSDCLCLMESSPVVLWPTHPDQEWSGPVGLHRTLWATCSSNRLPLIHTDAKFVRFAAGKDGRLCTPCPPWAVTRAAVTCCSFAVPFPWDSSPTFWGRGRNHTWVSFVARRLGRAAPAWQDGPAALFSSQDRPGHSGRQGSGWVTAVAVSCYTKTFSCSSQPEGIAKHLAALVFWLVILTESLPSMSDPAVACWLCPWSSLKHWEYHFTLFCLLLWMENKST